MEKNADDAKARDSAAFFFNIVPDASTCWHNNAIWAKNVYLYICNRNINLYFNCVQIENASKY